jgi:hypothetical protein
LGTVHEFESPPVGWWQLITIERYPARSDHGYLSKHLLQTNAKRLEG